MAKREVVGRDLGGDADAVSLRPPHKLHAACGADVGDVHVGACLPCESKVAGDGAFFGCSGDPLKSEPGRDPALVHHAARKLRVLTVVDHRQAKGRSVLEGPAHDRGG